MNRADSSEVLAVCTFEPTDRLYIILESIDRLYIIFESIDRLYIVTVFGDCKPTNSSYVKKIAPRPYSALSLAYSCNFTKRLGHADTEPIQLYDP